MPSLISAARRPIQRARKLASKGIACRRPAKQAINSPSVEQRYELVCLRPSSRHLAAPRSTQRSARSAGASQSATSPPATWPSEVGPQTSGQHCCQAFLHHLTEPHEVGIRPREGQPDINCAADHPCGARQGLLRRAELPVDKVPGIRGVTEELACEAPALALCQELPDLLVR